ncbi:MAG: patatin-like phospholipase family protein [Endomicrobiaceae bacterium]|nr:patatin-like phospholipase family protein [Endomicrobiaceae bacterium]MDD3054173.1 patatin-like phospholipase family protein [Endomicrobiaceae bacterium]MDD3922468.1 patatin-like phospholipase family protein [Endomicrobiaceae bacterium]
MKKAIALGGGGARGLAHIGVLKVLEENGIKFDCIAGTSMGAIIGALYAIEQDAVKLEKILKKYFFDVMFSKLNMQKMQDETQASSARSLIRKAREFVKYGSADNGNSFLSHSMLEEMVDALLPDIDIADTKIPFICVATDITNGKEKMFTKGSLRKIVLASASIPGVFPPVNIDNVWYTDGAHVNVTPVSAAKLLGADFIIASDVKSKLKVLDGLPTNSKDIMNRCNFIANYLFYEVLIKEANIVIEPNIKQISWSEFNKFNLMVSEGEKSAKAQLETIKKEINKFNAPAAKCKRLLKHFLKLTNLKAAIY